MSGDCRAIVIKTGDHTLIGSIAGLAGKTTTAKSSMEIEMAHVVRFITFFAIVVAVIFFAISLARGRGVTFSIINALLLTLGEALLQGGRGGEEGRSGDAVR